MVKKRSFLERLTGSIRMDEKDEELNDEEIPTPNHSKRMKLSGKELPIQEDYEKESKWEEEEEDAQLTVDLYQTPNDLIVQTMIAGVLPENLSITITRDVISIKGKREENKAITQDNYFIQELYWGSFSRTISLPEEINPEEAEAVEKHGLLIIKLPKVDKNRETKLKIKSI
jgi:HSP20 family protein